MTTARMLMSRGIRSTSSTQQSMGDLAYGTAGILQMIQVASGMASSILETLPLFSMVFAATDILKALDESWSAPKGKKNTANAEIHLKSLVKVLTNGTLFTIGYETLAHSMSLGSTVFSSMCGGFAIKAAGDFTLSLIDFGKASSKLKRARTHKKDRQHANDAAVIINPAYVREYEEARIKLFLNTLNLLGWGLLTLSQTAAMTAVAPHLFLLGSAFLVLAGLYAIKRVFTNYSDVYAELFSYTNDSRISRKFALTSIFSRHAYGSDLKNEAMPLSEQQEYLLVRKPS